MSGLPKGWAIKKLDKCTTITMGQSPKGIYVNSEGEGIPFYQGKSEFGKLYPTPKKYCTEPSKLAIQDDILLSVRAPVGPTNLCPETSCIGRGLASIRALELMSQMYFLHYMRYLQPWLSEQGTGTTFKAISGAFLKDIEVIVAPLNEQIRIADKLDSILAKVDKAQARLDKIPAILKRFRQSVLAAATSGELTKEWREAHLGLCIDRDKIRIERDRLFKLKNKAAKEAISMSSAMTEELYELPDSWEWFRAEEFSDLITKGTTPKKDKMDSSFNVPYIKVYNLTFDQ